MKNTLAISCAAVTLLLLPALADAQTVTFANAPVSNTSASVQQSFLTELQSLEQELASLEATINAMITAAGGTPSTSNSSIGTSSTVAPLIAPPMISSISTGSGDDPDLSSALLAAIAPSTSTTTNSLPVSAGTTTSAPATVISTSNQNISNQLDPTCISGLFSQGAQCGGLYYCGVGISGGYWSSTSCTNNSE